MINNTQKTINSIGIQSELALLESYQQDFEETINLPNEEITRTERELVKIDFEEWKKINSPQIALLDSLNKQASHLSYWDYGHGTILIRDDYFMEYIQQETRDKWYGKNCDWLIDNVNWDNAVKKLMWDYIVIAFDGVIYWAKNE